MLVGDVAPQAFQHIQHLLLAFPTTPGQQGFLVGLLGQTRALDDQAKSLQVYLQRGYFLSVQCNAQSVIDIIEGAKGQNYRPLSPDCASRNVGDVGDGYGLMGNDGYLAGAAEHASLAAAAPDASDHLRQHAQHVQIATTNIKGWLATLDQDAVAVLNASTGPTPNVDAGKVQELVSLSDNSLYGIDKDGDENVDPVIGEAGAVTAYQHGQLLAILELKPPK
jgi:hypothetical protein